MEQRVLEKSSEATNKLLDIARERVKVPEKWLKVEYQEDADILYIKLSDKPSVISNDDMDNGIIFDYDKNKNLVGIEILDFYSV